MVRHNIETETILNNHTILESGSGLKKKITQLTNFDILNVCQKIKNFRGCSMEDDLQNH